MGSQKQPLAACARISAAAGGGRRDFRFACPCVVRPPRIAACDQRLTAPSGGLAPVATGRADGPSENILSVGSGRGFWPVWSNRMGVSRAVWTLNALRRGWQLAATTPPRALSVDPDTVYGPGQSISAAESGASAACLGAPRDPSPVGRSGCPPAHPPESRALSVEPDTVHGPAQSISAADNIASSVFVGNVRNG